MEFNDVYKTGLRTQIRQPVPEIYHFPRRNPPFSTFLKFFEMKKLPTFRNLTGWGSILHIIK